MTDVFISYKREERDKVVLIADRLRSLGLDVWFDARLTTGHHFDREIDQHVRKAKCVLVCWSEGALASEWVRAEAAIGRERNVLVPLLVESCSPPVPFNTLQTENLIGWAGEADHDGWLRAVDQIAGLAQRPELAQEQRARGHNERERRRTQALLEAQRREEEEAQRVAAIAAGKRAELEAQLASMGASPAPNGHMPTFAAARAAAQQPHRAVSDESIYARLFRQIAGPRTQLAFCYLFLLLCAVGAFVLGAGAVNRGQWDTLAYRFPHAIPVLAAVLAVLVVTELKKRSTKTAPDANPRHALIQTIIVGASVMLAVGANNAGLVDTEWLTAGLAAAFLRFVLPFGGLREASKTRLGARRAFNAAIVGIWTAACLSPLLVGQEAAAPATAEAPPATCEPPFDAAPPENGYWDYSACTWFITEPAAPPPDAVPTP